MRRGDEGIAWSKAMGGRDGGGAGFLAIPLVLVLISVAAEYPLWLLAFAGGTFSVWVFLRYLAKPVVLATTRAVGRAARFSATVGRRFVVPPPRASGASRAEAWTDWLLGLSRCLIRPSRREDLFRILLEVVDRRRASGWSEYRIRRQIAGILLRELVSRIWKPLALLALAMAVLVLALRH